MDFAEPAGLVLSPSTAAVIRVIAGADDAFTGRQLARLAGISHTQAIKMANRLAEHGLVLVEQRGSSKLYRINRTHLAANALIELTQLRKRLLAHLSDRIEKWALAPLHASLFGSAARGDGNTASDIDILLIRPTDTKPDDIQWAEQLFDTATWVRNISGNDVSWFNITLDELQRAATVKEPIIEEWRRDALRLAGEALPTMLRKTP